MRQFPEGTPIRVQVDDEGRPTFLVWNGRPDRIASIEDVREPQVDWWAATGEVHRIYYLITIEGGMIGEIYRDVVGGGWYLARVLD